MGEFVGKRNFLSQWCLSVSVYCRRAFSGVLYELMRASSARTSLKFIAVLLAVLLPCSVLLYETNLRANSNIITVNTLSDSSGSHDGVCSLREAVNNANSASDTTSGDCAAGTGTDTIVFNLSGQITLGSTLPAIVNALTIDGSSQTIIVDGAGSYQVLV